MHTFQPISTDLLELNPFTKFGKEWALVTTGTRQNPNTMTISWGGLGVLWNKNVAYIFIRDSRYTKELLDKDPFFSISFFTEEHRAALSYCGSHSGRDENKIQKAGLTPASRHSIPYIDDASLVLFCNTLSAARITAESFLTPEIAEKFYADGDMHTMYIAEIIDIIAR